MEVWILKWYDKDTMDWTIVGVFSDKANMLRYENMYPGEQFKTESFVMNDFDQDLIDQMRNIRK